MLSFRYFDYDAQKAKVFRKEGAAYEVSPVGLLRSDERYYLVALQNGEKRHYRVDRMADARPLEQERTRPAPGWICPPIPAAISACSPARSGRCA